MQNIVLTLSYVFRQPLNLGSSLKSSDKLLTAKTGRFVFQIGVQWTDMSELCDIGILQGGGPLY